MIRYAIVRAHASAHDDWKARAKLAQLTERPSCAGLLLFTTPEVPVVQRPHAVLVGSLHARLAQAGGPERAPLDDPDALVRDWWGTYVCFSLADRQLDVLRDPGGGLPCYHWSCGTADLFLSDAETAAALGVATAASVDDRFLSHWLQYPYLRTARTGVTGVEELLPGMSLREHAGHWSRSLAWRPGRHAQSAGGWQQGEAATVLRERTLETIATELRGSRPLLQLSGGLDSSIIAVSLHASAIPFEAVTFATSSPDGDEQAFAHAVAKQCGARLGVVRESAGSALSLEPSRPTFRPGANLLLRTVDLLVEDYRQRTGCTLLIDGAGGDNLFGSSISAAPAADALLAGHGFGTIADVARRTGRSWWTVARATLVELRPQRTRLPWPEDRRFVSDAALLSSSDDHPWLTNTRGLSPGKREHLRSLVHIQHFLDRHETAAAVAHPLYAQPLLELCLHIPSWLTVAGGRDRAVARDAFRPLLPAAVVERRTKGSLEGLLFRRFARLEQQLRPLLLEGELSRRGLVDRATIENALRDRAWAKSGDHVRLSELATLELWLRGWRSMG